MMPGLIRKDGYDYAAIQVVFDAYGIDPERRPGMFDRVLSLINVFEKERRKRNAN
jgi:hypothetical protein